LLALSKSLVAQRLSAAGGYFRHNGEADGTGKMTQLLTSSRISWDNFAAQG